MPSKLTADQEREVASQFVDIIVDGMDTKTLVAYVTDHMNEYFESCSSIELEEEINNYDDELYAELVDDGQSWWEPLMDGGNFEIFSTEEAE